MRELGDSPLRRAFGEGFAELVPPEVPRQMVVPAAVVMQDNVDEYEQYAFD